MIAYKTFIGMRWHPGTGKLRDAECYVWYVFGIPVYRRIEFLK